MNVLRKALPIAALTVAAAPLLAGEWQNSLHIEHWQFADAGAQGQARSNLSLSFKSEWWHGFNDGRDSLAFSPFLRLDQHDDRRSHWDIREAAWTHLGDGFELRAGIRQVFWGVTEGAHLVDIINQTDLVESLDGEQKLGQPMINLAFERDAQMLDLFVLPGFRPRTYPGEDGRLRLPLVVDADDAEYEAANGARHVDLAARWQLNLPALRLGLSAFRGTSREPELRPEVDYRQVLTFNGQPYAFAPGYQPQLTPYYPQIRQFGVDLQITQGDLLWKLESVRRSGGRETYNASDAGIEYTQVGVLGSQADLGWLLEYLHDSRGARATSPFADDLLLGWRLALNDQASSELLTSLIVDRDSGERLFSIEANRRLSDQLRLELELRAFGHTPSRPQQPFDYLLAYDDRHPLRPLSRDDFLRIGLSWFF
ncbi:MAG TPA: hypothetical protein VLG17_20130 [Pseudomonas sp.]|uniref:hypothetical protein n=1 Tax=Pseudomonas sp. TaxID=306 RepID=UPI002CA447C2|nr:hypothetical protein [Pseudomonas sp.]HSX90293.1 hypothetical protein [Pseudomonas sp.]